MAKEVKKLAGHPPKYSSPEELQKKIAAYFADCDKREKPYTIMGLTMALGFSSRQSLFHYCDRKKDSDRFVDIIKNAKAKVVGNVEELLLAGKNAVGAIFWLKNNGGYADKQEVAQNVNMTVGLPDAVKGIFDKIYGVK